MTAADPGPPTRPVRRVPLARGTAEPEPPAASRFSGRRLVEMIVALGLITVAVGVWLVTDHVGWGLIAAGVLTVGFALVIVDVPARPVYTGRRGEG